MLIDNPFDNGIDGTPWAEAEGEEIADWYEKEYSVHYKSVDLEITAWPTYGNYVIETDKYLIYYYPGARIISIPGQLDLENQDLSFFGTRTGPEYYNIEYYSGAEINKKIERYLNLKVFL